MTGIRQPEASDLHDERRRRYNSDDVEPVANTSKTMAHPADQVARELRQLLEKAIERLLSNVDKDGFSIPMAFAITPDGQDVIVVSEAREDEPEPADPRAGLQQQAESIMFSIRRMIDAGQLRAFAFARNVSVTLETDAGLVPQTAIKVIHDHEAGSGSIAYLVYDPNQGQAKPIELFYNDLDERYFPEGGWPADKPRLPFGQTAGKA